MPGRKLRISSPARVLLLSLLAMLCIGTILLALPIARTQPVSLLDLLFTVVSATTVTGLLVVPLESFSLLGQAVILLLVQVGAVGIVTLSLFLMSLFVDFGLGTQFFAGQILELENWNSARRILVFSILFTLAIELIAAFLIFFTLSSEFSLGYRLFWSLFQAVSSFGSAGLSLLPGDIIAYKDNLAL
ncbi:MAG TPA: potassium transporter TrkG, partial [Candidatus Babeliaceae bacterium]|nr:potassium transporter TrkG [Candidatus Babeliaceae bacterium]